jgi:hypothetical protein
MATVKIDLPDELVRKLAEFASQQDVPVEQFAASLLTEFVQTCAGEEYFRFRAARGSREKFLAAMAKVPNVSPVPPDEAM